MVQCFGVCLRFVIECGLDEICAGFYVNKSQEQLNEADDLRVGCEREDAAVEGWLLVKPSKGAHAEDGQGCQAAVFVDTEKGGQGGGCFFRARCSRMGVRHSIGKGNVSMSGSG